MGRPPNKGVTTRLQPGTSREAGAESLYDLPQGAAGVPHYLLSQRENPGPKKNEGVSPHTDLQPMKRQDFMNCLRVLAGQVAFNPQPLLLVIVEVDEAVE